MIFYNFLYNKNKNIKKFNLKILQKKNEKLNIITNKFKNIYIVDIFNYKLV